MKTDPHTGRLIHLAADCKGAAQYGENILGAEGMTLEAQYAGESSSTVAVDADATWHALKPEQAGTGFALDKLSLGKRLKVTIEAHLDSHKPRLHLRTHLEAREPVTLTVTGRWSIPFATEAKPRSVFFAGRQGMVPNDPSSPEGESFEDALIGVCGKVHKDEDERTLFAYHEGKRKGDGKITGVRQVDRTRCLVTLANGVPAGGELRLAAGESTSFEIVLDFGHPDPEDLPGCIAQLKPTYSTFEAKAQNYLFWLSLIGTVRQYDGGLGLAHTTAAYIECPKDVFEAYRACWVHDPFFGYYCGGKYVAGPAMFDVVANYLRFFHRTPHQIDQRLRPNFVQRDGTLGGPCEMLSDPEVLLMSCDYHTLMGGLPPGVSLADVKARADLISRIFIEEFNPFGTGTIFEPDNGYYSWPDIPNDAGQPIQRGVNVFMNAYGYRALRQVSNLCRQLGDLDAAQKYAARAERLQRDINKPANDTDPKAGLWWEAKGTYGAMKFIDRKTMKNEDMGVFLAILWGLTGRQSRINSVLNAIGDVNSSFYEGAVPTRFTRTDYADAGSKFTQLEPLIGGWDLSARLRNRNKDAGPIWDKYIAEYRALDYPMREAYSVGSPGGQCNGNRGRIMESGVFYNIVYYGHYGLDYSPAHVSINPFPIKGVIDGEKIVNFRWRGRRYDFLFQGNGSRAIALRVNGRDWPSRILPPMDCRVEVQMGEEGLAPQVVRATELLAITDARSTDGRLQLEVAAVPGGWEELTVFYPRAFGVPRVQRGLGRTGAIRSHYDSASQELTIALRCNDDKTIKMDISGKNTPVSADETLVDNMEDYPQFDWLEEGNSVVSVASTHDPLPGAQGIPQGCSALEVSFKAGPNEPVVLTRKLQLTANNRKPRALQLMFSMHMDAPESVAGKLSIEAYHDGTRLLSSQSPVQPGPWRKLTIPLPQQSGWTAADRLTIRLEPKVAMPWRGSFQIDDVKWLYE